MRTALLIVVLALTAATLPACNAAQLGALLAQAKLAADDAAAAKAELGRAQATAARSGS